MTLQAANESGTLQFYDWFSEQFLLLCAIVLRKQWLMSGKFPGTRLLAQSIITDVIRTIWNWRMAFQCYVYHLLFQQHFAGVFVSTLSSTEQQHKTRHLNLFSIAYNRKTSTTKAKVPKDTWWCVKTCNCLCSLYIPPDHRLHSRCGLKMCHLFPPMSWQENFTEPLRKKQTSSPWSLGNLSSDPFKRGTSELGFPTNFPFPWPFFIYGTFSISVAVLRLAMKEAWL